MSNYTWPKNKTKKEPNFIKLNNKYYIIGDGIPPKKGKEIDILKKDKTYKKVKIINALPIPDNKFIAEFTWTREEEQEYWDRYNSRNSYNYGSKYKGDADGKSWDDYDCGSYGMDYGDFC